MSIGIIGAGPIGSTLARELTALGHEVRVANSRGPASLAALAKAKGAGAATVENVVREAELVIVAIPERSVAELPSWRQQPGTPLCCTDLNSDGVRRALARADRAKALARDEERIP